MQAKKLPLVIGDDDDLFYVSGWKSVHQSSPKRSGVFMLSTRSAVDGRLTHVNISNNPRAALVVVGVADDSSDASVAIYTDRRHRRRQHSGCSARTFYSPSSRASPGRCDSTSFMFRRQREKSFFSNRIREFSIRVCIRERGSSIVWKSRLTLHHHHLCRDMTRHLTHSHFNLSFFFFFGFV